MLNEEVKQMIYDLYINKGLSVNKVEKLLEGITTRHFILKYLRSEKLIRKMGVYRTVSCIENYFSNIDTERKAYWLGVLFADGNVSKKNDRTLGMVRFSSKDKEWVEQFLKELLHTGKLCTEVHKVYKKEIYKINIDSDIMFNDLCNLGCIPRKSLIIKFPNIPKEFIPHFIRGYFDGDGTVGIYKNSSKCEYYTLRSGFCSGSKEFLEVLSTFLPTKTNNIKKCKEKILYTLTFSVNDSIKLYLYMYKDATMWLDRKKQIFEKFIREKRSETIIDPSQEDEGIVQT